MGLGKWGINPTFQIATKERLPFRDIDKKIELCNVT
jgi:hypothetical protein